MFLIRIDIRLSAQNEMRARAALRALRKRGIRIYMASGRGLDSLRVLRIDDIPFDGYVTYNGQLCYDRNRHFLFGNPIPETGRKALCGLFRERAFPVILIGREKSVINMTNRRTDRLRKDFRLTVPPVGKLSDKDDIYQALVLATPEEEKSFRGSLAGCRITRWFAEGVDIIPENGSKIVGIRRIAAHDGIRADEIMAFGDSENDVEMLRGAGIGVAMGNAALRKDICKKQVSFPFGPAYDTHHVAFFPLCDVLNETKKLSFHRKMQRNNNRFFARRDTACKKAALEKRETRHER